MRVEKKIKGDLGERGSDEKMEQKRWKRGQVQVKTGGKEVREEVREVTR